MSQAFTNINERCLTEEIYFPSVNEPKTKSRFLQKDSAISIVKFSFILIITLNFQLSIINSACYSQTIYIVDHQYGSDDNDGITESTAWKTLQKAFNSATPGSTVLIKGGTYIGPFIVNVSGGLSNPTWFKRFDESIVTLTINSGNPTPIMTIRDKSNLVFESLDFVGTTANNAIGILVENSEESENLWFMKLKISNVKWDNDPLKIPNSENNAQPFIVYGRGNASFKTLQYVNVVNCEFFNNITGFSECLTLEGHINAFVIKNNIIHDNTNIGIDIAGNYGTATPAANDHPRQGIISGNICYNNVSRYATSAGIYIDGGFDVTVERNICNNNGWGIEVGCEENGTTENIIVRNNFIYNNLEAGIAAGGYNTETNGYVTNCTITNNTCVDNNTSKSGTGELYMTKLTSSTIKNNIFYSSQQETMLTVENIEPQADNKLDYNCWFTYYENPTFNWRDNTLESFDSYREYSTQEKHSIFINPELEAGTVVLMKNSPCIDAGDSTIDSDIGDIDFLGRTRIINNRVDIGGYEYNPNTDVDPKPTLPKGEGVELVIYPNPSDDKITVHLTPTLPKREGVEIEIYNVFGEVAISQTLTGSQSLTVDISTLPVGTYICKASAGNWSTATMFVVIR